MTVLPLRRLVRPPEERIERQTYPKLPNFHIRLARVDEATSRFSTHRQRFAQSARCRFIAATMRLRELRDGFNGCSHARRIDFMHVNRITDATQHGQR